MSTIWRSLAMISAVIHSQTAWVCGQDLLGDNVTYAGFDLELVEYATLPASTPSIISMTTRPGMDPLYVSTQEGVVYQVARNPNGVGDVTAWFDVNQTLLDATGKGLNFQNSAHGGLRAIAFHPDFSNPTAAGYGKLYASVMQDRPDNPSGHFYLGESNRGINVNGDSALFEFTYDFVNQQVAVNLTRELFRVNMPVYDHPIKQIRFNNRAQPGDADYGLLYVAHGDASVQSATAGGGQNPDDVLGKILRINPLQNGGSPYSIPTTNPFVDTPGTLEEIYALGFRNPHTFSFNRDELGNTYLIGADAGRDNIEEINIVYSGRNYGWSEREGTFVHLSSGGYINGVSGLPSNEASLNDFVYPAAQIDHNTGAVQADPGDGYVGFAIVTGHTIKNPVDSNLRGLYFYSNFGESGDVFYTRFEEMLDKVVDLDPGDPSRDHPSELSWAESNLIRLALDHDNNAATAPILHDNFNSILGDFRSDTRFGEGARGEMYISSKRNGAVYLAPGTLPASVLTLSVDRATGAVSIVNFSGEQVEIDGFSIQSMSGSLASAQFQPVDSAWSLSATNDSTKLTQLNENSSLVFSATTTANLGQIFHPQALAFGIAPGQDIQFLYTGPNSEPSLGYVTYVGDPTFHNTIVLSINSDGEAVLLNDSPFEVEVEAYRITSSANILHPDTWISLQDQNADNGTWSESSQSGASVLLELQEEGATIFGQNAQYNLGQILEPGFVTEGLTIEFLLAGGTTFTMGAVEFVSGIPGDFDGDGDVDGRDFLQWQRGNSPSPLSAADLAAWQTHFGEGGSWVTGALAIPEPSAACLLLSAVTLFVWYR